MSENTTIETIKIERNLDEEIIAIKMEGKVFVSINKECKYCGMIV